MRGGKRVGGEEGEREASAGRGPLRPGRKRTRKREKRKRRAVRQGRGGSFRKSAEQCKKPSNPVPFPFSPL